MTRTADPVNDAGERLLPEHKILRRVDYQRCYREGRRRYGSLVTLHFIGNELPHPRFGITASRKVGNSVTRHLLKRRLREIYRRWPQRTTLPGFDIVAHLKPQAKGSQFPALQAELVRLLSAVREKAQGGARGTRR